jgi:hypothetical protein
VDFEYSISHDDSLVNVVTQGFFDYLKAYEMWKEVVATCDKSGCYQVLGESQLAAPVPLIDAYEHVSLIESVGVTPDYQIAWVANDAAVLERLRLIESIVRDRSLFNVSMFESKADATRWLNASS